MRSTGRRLFLIALILATALVAVHEIGASVTVKGKGSVKKEFRFSAALTGASDDLLVVPEGRTFVVVDFHATNVTSGLARVGVTAGSGLSAVTPFYPVAQDEFIDLTYDLGPEIPAGSTVQILNFGGGSVSYFLSGYLRK